jgi:hypothetical protein
MREPYTEEVVQRETTSGHAAPEPAMPSATTSRTSVYRRTVPNDRVTQAIWWVVGLVETLIAIRFILKLFGASMASSFVRFMYDTTAGLVAPFHGIFNTVADGRSVLEPESLVAIAIYALLGWGIVSLIRLMIRPSRPTTVIE